MKARDPWIRRAVAVAVLASLPLFALAADRSQRTTEAEPARPADDGTAAAKTAKLLPPLTAEERVLAAIQKEGQERVGELATQLRAAASDEQRRALMREMVSLKTEYWVRFLSAKAEFARARGDARTVEAAARAIEQIRNPGRLSAPAAPSTTSEPQPAKGGRP